MNSLLAEILAEKHKEVEALKKRGAPIDMGTKIPFLRDFRGAISTPNKINLIAEIKFASPSAGSIRKKTDPVRIGQLYEEAGAAAVSYLTDERFFAGDLRHLTRLKMAVSLPILRKDFIIDEIQVKESFVYGADAVLLIARILSRQKLKELIALCRELGLAPLTEVHDQRDLEKAIDCGAEIIGINNRDLDSFQVDLQTTLELIPFVPEGHVIVSESGINTITDLQFLKEAGIQAVLVGTGLMKSEDILEKTREIIGASVTKRDEEWSKSRFVG